MEGVFGSATVVCSSHPGDSCLQRLKDEIAEVANEIESLGSTEER